MTDEERYPWLTADVRDCLITMSGALGGCDWPLASLDRLLNPQPSAEELVGAWRRFELDLAPRWKRPLLRLRHAWQDLWRRVRFWAWRFFFVGRRNFAVFEAAYDIYEALPRHPRKPKTYSLPVEIHYDSREWP